MTTVGLLVLARDEEACIARCLESVAPACAEMVVVDMQSKDATAAIASTLGARVVSVPVTHRFDGARQVGLDALTTDWVIQLDADEWATGLLERLADEGYLADSRPLAVPKINYLGGRWVTTNRWWPNRQVRVFPRAGARYTDTFHAHLQVPGEVRELPARPEYAISHGGYEDCSQMLASVSRFLPTKQHALSKRQVARALIRPLAGYLTSRAWRDGSDGLAILSAKILNATALEASRGKEPASGEAS
jgi:glycosyltransferase involved in cell wall biosynthesis